MIALFFQIENRLVNSLVGLHHRFDGEQLLDTTSAVLLLIAGRCCSALRLPGIVDQEARLTVLDHLAAGAEVHRDHRNAGGIGFCQDQPEPLGMVFRCNKAKACANNSFLPCTSTGPM